MFIIDQYQTNAEDGNLEISEEESVSDISSSIVSSTCAEVPDRRRRCFRYEFTFCYPFIAHLIAMTCARLFLPPSQCSMIIDTGTDFPEKFRNQLESLGKEMIWFRPRQAPTTRALNIYSGKVIG